jgi:hypothetical protein
MSEDMGELMRHMEMLTSTVGKMIRGEDEYQHLIVALLNGEVLSGDQHRIVQEIRTIRAARDVYEAREFRHGNYEKVDTADIVRDLEKLQEGGVPPSWELIWALVDRCS